VAIGPKMKVPGNENSIYSTSFLEKKFSSTKNSSYPLEHL